MHVLHVISESGTVPPTAGQWSTPESFHGQFRQTGRANLTVPPQEMLITFHFLYRTPFAQTPVLSEILTRHGTTSPQA